MEVVMEQKFDERVDADAPLAERRKLARHRTLKGGTISFNRAGGIDCRVRNLSPIGACLEVANQVGIPDEFVLIIESEHLRHHCKVVWRKATRLGVAFDG
jgi:hypothetical protein